MRQFFSLLTIYSLLHLSIPSAFAANSEKKKNFMKTIHELPQMAAGGLVTSEGLDDLIARGREVLKEEGNLDEKARINNNIIMPLLRVRDGRNRLDDCIAKRDPSVVERTGLAYLQGAFSKMNVKNDCKECMGENPDWTGLSEWSDQMLLISDELEKDKRNYFDEKTEDLKERLFISERERLLVPYLAVKASIEKEPLAETPSEVLRKMGVATTRADTLPVSSLPLMPIQGHDNPYNDSIIDDNLKRTVQNMIDFSREKSEQDKSKEREQFFTKTNNLIESYNENYRRLNGKQGERVREQIEEVHRDRLNLGRQLASMERTLQHEKNEEKRVQLARQVSNLQGRLRNTDWRKNSLDRSLAQMEWNVKELEQKMAINPIINGSALDRDGRGRKAHSVRQELFHQVDNITREQLTDEQMEKYLKIYYEASENLLKSLDRWNRDPDPTLLIENTLYANPAIAGEVLSESPEMVGRICYFIEKAVKEKDRNRRWDKIMDWAKIVAAVAIILASGGALLAGGVAIAAAIGFSGIGLAALGVASGSYNLVRGLRLRSEYQEAKEHLIVMGYGDEAEVEEVLKLSKRRFMNAAMDYGLAASSGLAMINGIPAVAGGLPGVIQQTSTIAGINNLITLGAKSSVLVVGASMMGCKNILLDMDSDGDGVPDTEDDDPVNTDYDYSLPCLQDHPDYTGPINADGCPSKYPIDKDCYNVSEFNNIPPFSWDYDGNLDLISMFKLHWGRSANDFPDSEISIDNQTQMSFDFNNFGGVGDFYVTVSGIGFDMVESGTAPPIMVKICQ